MHFDGLGVWSLSATRIFASICGDLMAHTRRASPLQWLEGRIFDANKGHLLKATALINYGRSTFLHKRMRSSEGVDEILWEVVSI